MYIIITVNISHGFIKHSCNKVITNPPILQHVSIIHEYYKAVRNTIFLNIKIFWKRMLSLYTLRNASFTEAYIEMHVSGTIAEIAGMKTRYKKASEW